MTKNEVEAIKQQIDLGYRERDDYPSFALTPWDDRNRYREYVFRIIDGRVEVK